MAIRAAGTLPPEAVALADAVLDLALSYRDGALIQLAFGLEQSDDLDHTQRPEGARAAAGRLGAAFAERHIPAVRDAYQNIGKNSANLARGNEAAFDSLLAWMNGAARPAREALFSYVAARVALTARPVSPMPALNRIGLTFAAVARFMDALLDIPSGGAFEQFAVAAFLEALADDYGLTGVNGVRVETKNINASDASSGAAADVQVKRGNRAEEAFEVSANDWRTKVAQAVEAGRFADLPRSHIIAAETADPRDLSALDGLPVDVTALEVRGFLRVLTAVLNRPGRELALTRLYELVDRLQPDVKLTNQYVAMLGNQGLTAPA